ncbi:MAG: GTP cyclohydrolase II [Saprospiraceae bacterium]|nr:GTP cyclohydrolase II [Saprospiraceae bacterium]MCB0676445.1 GTP cyclohydrolase II [Saprospiraceae bacterium]MCB0683465.1 GTP cyclohydrolase II [Saprospiraceae bacterium]
MKRQAEAVIPTPWGAFNMIAYADDPEESMPHLALVHENFDREQPVLVRIHSECLTGDLFGSTRCDCGEQLHRALELTAAQGGVVIYLRQEGRGIGLINKLKAYRLQDAGLNTLDANVHLGFEIDSRQYDMAVQIMQDLGISEIHLLTNNPDKVEAVDHSPIVVRSRIPLVVKPRKENMNYLKAKQELLGHFL